MKSQRLIYVGVLLGGAMAGAVAVGMMSASASSGGSTAPPSTHASQHAAPGEVALTGAKAATARAAALKAVPGGTIERIETDSGDAAYEAHMTKADGTQVTVKF